MQSNGGVMTVEQAARKPAYIVESGPAAGVIACARMARAAETLAREGVEAVAVALLHAYADPRHERRVAEILRARLPAGVYVTCSADILPEVREYERSSTAVVNAYVGPIVRDYLAALEGDLRGLGVGGAL